MWSVKVECIEHNHDFTQYLESRGYLSRQKKIVVKLVDITALHIISTLWKASLIKHYKYCKCSQEVH